MMELKTVFKGLKERTKQSEPPVLMDGGYAKI